MSAVEVSTPARTLRFEIGGSTYDAVSYGQPWNGMVTPVVTREVLNQIVADMAGEGDYYTFTWSGDVLTVHHVELDEDDMLVPTEDGTYDLSTLGWVFCDETETEDSDEYVVVADLEDHPTVPDAVRTALGLPRLTRHEAVRLAREGYGAAVPVS